MIFSSATSPLISVSINGQSLAGLLHFTAAETNSFAADTFSLTAVLGPPPLTDIAFWASASTLSVQIEAVAAGSQSASTLMVGTVDTMTVDPLREVVSLEGRDLSARLIDSYWQQDFVNQTAAEVVTAIVARYGLTPAISATQGMVGRYYGDDYTRLSLGQFSRLRTNWDLIVELARANQYDAFVNGQTFYFQPSVALNSTPILVRTTDVSTMRIENSVFLSSADQSRMQSWNSQDMAAYSNNVAASEADTVPYLFSAANLASGQVDAAASRFNTEIQRLRTVLHFEMPWNLDITSRTLILLTGTSSPFDTTYLGRVDGSPAVRIGGFLAQIFRDA